MESVIQSMEKTRSRPNVNSEKGTSKAPFFYGRQPPQQQVEDPINIKTGGIEWNAPHRKLPDRAKSMVPVGSEYSETLNSAVGRGRNT